MHGLSCKYIKCLEAERVRLVTLRERESGSEVLSKERTLVLDGSKDILVQRLLVSDLAFSKRRLVGWVSKERRLSLDLGSLFTAEVCIVQLVVHLDVANVDLRASSNHICLVHTADRHTVQLEWTRHEQKTTLELFQEDNTFSTEATSEEDEYSAGSDAFTQLRWLWRLAVHLLSAHIVGWVEAWSLVCGKHTLARVLSAADCLLLGGDWRLFRGRSWLAASVLVATLLRVQLATAKTTDVRANCAVTGHGTL